HAQQCFDSPHTSYSFSLPLLPLLFSFPPPPPPEIYTLSLHDALPISSATTRAFPSPTGTSPCGAIPSVSKSLSSSRPLLRTRPRSEEHTSELQSRGHLVCRLLLEKKKKKQKKYKIINKKK